jgi:hypothetical protein
VEFFASPALAQAVFAASQKHPNINFFAVDSNDNEICSSGSLQAEESNGFNLLDLAYFYSRKFFNYNGFSCQ